MYIICIQVIHISCIHVTCPLYLNAHYTHTHTRTHIYIHTYVCTYGHCIYDHTYAEMINKMKTWLLKKQNWRISGSHLGSRTLPKSSLHRWECVHRSWQLLGQVGATELLRQRPFQAPDIRSPARPEYSCSPGPGGFWLGNRGSHLGSGNPLKSSLQKWECAHRSFCDRQKQHSFWERFCFGPSSSARREVRMPNICAPSQ